MQVLDLAEPYVFDSQMLDHLQIIHDHSGPRCAYAFYLGRDDYMINTSDLDTTKVEEFIASFYTYYNRHLGNRY